MGDGENYSPDPWIDYSEFARKPVKRETLPVFYTDDAKERMDRQDADWSLHVACVEEHW